MTTALARSARIAVLVLLLALLVRRAHRANWGVRYR